MLQSGPILQETFVDPPWSWPRGDKLPGVGPVASADWLRLDEAFALQMKLRDRLLDDRPQAVLACEPDAHGAAEETLKECLSTLRSFSEFVLSTQEVRRPDGVVVPVDWDRPLRTLGRLVQEDICLLQERDGAHRLEAAVLCFPASWTLAEKIGKPMAAVHGPVDEYDALLGRRVDRMFRALQPGTTLRRGNCLPYDDFALHQPRRETDRRDSPGPDATYIRAERQCLFKLPVTGAIVFSIHTSVCARAALRPKERAAAMAFISAVRGS